MKRLFPSSTWICLAVVTVLSGLAPLAQTGDTAQVRSRAGGSAQSITLAELIGQPDRYVGRAIRVEGKIEDVCPRAGCWIDIGDDQGHSIRFLKAGRDGDRRPVQLTTGRFSLPLDHASLYGAWFRNR